jgi:hypothetical protein
MFNWLRLLFRKIFRYDWGKLELNHGKHMLYVPTTIRPSQVWVRYTETGRDGCGQLIFNVVRCEPRGKGIDFYVEVNTEKCSIEWFATT